MPRRPLTLTRRWNADGSITLLCRGMKVIRYEGARAHQSAQDFAQGWYGDHPVMWGRSQFRHAKADKGLNS